MFAPRVLVPLVTVALALVLEPLQERPKE